jgi:hypothetical protein
LQKARREKRDDEQAGSKMDVAWEISRRLAWQEDHESVTTDSCTPRSAMVPFVFFGRY